MFDIGFLELVIIGIVGLLVIGPERLPDAIRTGNLWLSKIRRGFNDIKQEVKQELHNDAVMQELRKTGEQLKEQTDGISQEIKDASRSVTDTMAVNEPQATPEVVEQAQPANKALVPDSADSTTGGDATNPDIHPGKDAG